MESVQYMIQNIENICEKNVSRERRGRQDEIKDTIESVNYMIQNIENKTNWDNIRDCTEVID